MIVDFNNRPGEQLPTGFKVTYDFKPTGLPERRRVEVRDMAELMQEFSAYCEAADATGEALVVFFGVNRLNAARKFNGFDKAAKEARYFTPAARLS
jgi:hypothetical protein